MSGTVHLHSQGETNHPSTYIQAASNDPSVISNEHYSSALMYEGYRYEKFPDALDICHTYMRLYSIALGRYWCRRWNPLKNSFCCGSGNGTPTRHSRCLIAES